LTYILDGTEYLDSQERDIYEAIIVLAGRGRTVNNSQIASETGISRTEVARRTTRMEARKFIKNTGKGSAYHWRVTDKQAPREPQPVPPGSFNWGAYATRPERGIKVRAAQLAQRSDPNWWGQAQASEAMRASWVANFEPGAQREHQEWLAQFRTEPRAAEPAGQCRGECDEAREPRRVTADENEDVPVIYAVQGSQPLQVMVGVTKDGRVLLGAPTLDLDHPVHWQSQLDSDALSELQQALGWAALEQTQRQGS
jgi:DNA-binding Lrp family transcriptional regulator